MPEEQGVHGGVECADGDVQEDLSELPRTGGVIVAPQHSRRPSAAVAVAVAVGDTYDAHNQLLAHQISAVCNVRKQRWNCCPAGWCRAVHRWHLGEILENRMQSDQPVPTATSWQLWQCRHHSITALASLHTADQAGSFGENQVAHATCETVSQSRYPILRSSAHRSAAIQKVGGQHAASKASRMRRLCVRQP